MSVLGSAGVQDSVCRLPPIRKILRTVSNISELVRISLTLQLHYIISTELVRVL